MDKWLKFDYEGWLQVRSMKLGGGKDELYNQMFDSIKSKNGPPPPLKNVGLDENAAARGYLLH